MRRDCRAWQRSTTGTVATADGCRLGLGRLSAPRSAGLRDTPRFHSDTRAQARRPYARVQGRAPAAPLARHRPAATRRLARGDRPAPPPQSAEHDTDLCQSGHRGVARDRAALARSGVMSPLQVALDEYLAARRALGHKLRLPGRLLQRFVTFADSSGVTCITTEIALAWAMQPAKAQPAQWANRLAMV